MPSNNFLTSHAHHSPSAATTSHVQTLLASLHSILRRRRLQDRAVRILGIGLELLSHIIRRESADGVRRRGLIRNRGLIQLNEIPTKESPIASRDVGNNDGDEWWRSAVIVALVDAELGATVAWLVLVGRGAVTGDCVAALIYWGVGVAGVFVDEIVVMALTSVGGVVDGQSGDSPLEACLAGFDGRSCKRSGCKSREEDGFGKHFDI